MTPELPLRDIHLPQPPGWWPPAPGWWLLATIVIVLLAWLLLVLWRRWRKRCYRCDLLQAVDAVWDAHPEPDGGAEIIAGWSALLRRACLRHRPQAVGVDMRALIADLGLTDHLDPQHQRLLADGAFRRKQTRDGVACLRQPMRILMLRIIDENADV